jgi:hypothetical protein
MYKLLSLEVLMKAFLDPLSYWSEGNMLGLFFNTHALRNFIFKIWLKSDEFEGIKNPLKDR